MTELIYKQSALSVCKEYSWIDEEDFIEGYNTAIKDISEAIKELTTVEAEPVRHGWWIETKYNPVGDTMYCDCNCSNCNFEITREKERYPKFCENCGARMDVDHIADVSKKVGADNDN